MDVSVVRLLTQAPDPCLWAHCSGDPQKEAAGCADRPPFLFKSQNLSNWNSILQGVRLSRTRIRPENRVPKAADGGHRRRSHDHTMQENRWLTVTRLVQ